MKLWVKDPAFSILSAVVLFAAVTLGCSGPPQGDIGSLAGATPTRDDDEEPFDPLAPGASIVCEVPARDGGEPDIALHVLSAMNHKLGYYPAFAMAFGQAQVTDCEGANRYRPAYSAYLREHPGFDADEPLPPAPEDPPPLDDDPADSPPEVSKVANAPAGIFDPAVVHITFESCTRRRKNGQYCPDADNSWNVPGGDLRRTSRSCSGTFISKNWILTSAHCITLAAVDSCMEKGRTLTNCNPRWDNYGKWVVRGMYVSDITATGEPNGTETLAEVFGMRSYVNMAWPGVILSKNQATCSAPDDCGDANEDDEDIALLYIDRRNDGRLPPRIEDDAAKRLTIVQPTLGWPLAIAGWGRPIPSGGAVLRQGNIPDAEVSYPGGGAAAKRIKVTTPLGGVHACPGDSGGPILRRNLRMDTNRGVRENLEAIVAVTASSFAKCQGADTYPVEWFGTLVQPHLKFIHDSLARWPWQLQTCVPRAPTGSPLGRDEVEECWGKPCTSDTQCVKDKETCQGNPGATFDRLPASDSMCNVCKKFTTGNLMNDCACLEGQCIPD
jgi:hypothetical protein